jgi:hypothetical protein
MMDPHIMEKLYSCHNCRGWRNVATCERLIEDGVCSKQQLSRLTTAMVGALQHGPSTGAWSQPEDSRPLLEGE